MTDEKKKMTAQGSSVGADDGQPISKNSENSIPTSGQKSNDEIVNSQDSLEEMYRKIWNAWKTSCIKNRRTQCWMQLQSWFPPSAGSGLALHPNWLKPSKREWSPTPSLST